MITACLIVHNEEKIIRQCLDSLKDLDIVVVHDGECTDRTLEIAKEYTDKVYMQPFVGFCEAHRQFAWDKAQDWILMIDADEFIYDLEAVKKLTEGKADGYVFRWEMWNGKKPIRFKGLQKLCLFRKDKVTMSGMIHDNPKVDGLVENTDIVLGHKPIYSNLSFREFRRKTKRWSELHASYLRDWDKEFMFPLKTLVAQLRNGLWTSWYGIKLAVMHAYYWHQVYKKIDLPFSFYH